MLFYSAEKWTYFYGKNDRVEVLLTDRDKARGLFSKIKKNSLEIISHWNQHSRARSDTHKRKIIIMKSNQIEEESAHI